MRPNLNSTGALILTCSQGYQHLPPDPQPKILTQAKNVALKCSKLFNFCSFVSTDCHHSSIYRAKSTQIPKALMSSQTFSFGVADISNCALATSLMSSMSESSRVVYLSCSRLQKYSAKCEKTQLVAKRHVVQADEGPKTYAVVPPETLEAITRICFTQPPAFSSAQTRSRLLSLHSGLKDLVLVGIAKGHTKPSDAVRLVLDSATIAVEEAGPSGRSDDAVGLLFLSLEFIFISIPTFTFIFIFIFISWVFHLLCLPSRYSLQSKTCHKVHFDHTSTSQLFWSSVQLYTVESWWVGID